MVNRVCEIRGILVASFPVLKFPSQLLTCSRGEKPRVGRTGNEANILVPCRTLSPVHMTSDEMWQSSILQVIATVMTECTADIK